MLLTNQDTAIESVKKEDIEVKIVEEKKDPERARSGTWSSETARKENVVVKKVQTVKDPKKHGAGDDRRQKRGETKCLFVVA